jgi:hypothetical protein
VCGFDDLSERPVDHVTCPCCGTQFGYHDARVGHDELRRRWIEGGMDWKSRRVPPPAHWSPVAQLLRAGFVLTADEQSALLRAQGSGVGA